MKIEALSNKELANLYGMSYSAMLDWLKPLKEKLGPKIRGRWTPKQVQQIIEHLGVPGKEVND